MPVENIYRFTIQGLAEQAFPGTNTSSTADLSLYFSPPWMFADPLPLLPLSSDLLNVLDQAGLAQRASSQRVTKPFLRFSKFSTVSTLMSYSEDQLQKGVCLALCRVLIVRIKNIPGFIEDADLVTAMQQGYDAVYSTLRYHCLLVAASLFNVDLFIARNMLCCSQISSYQSSSFMPTSPVCAILRLFRLLNNKANNLHFPLIYTAHWKRII